MSDTQIKKSDLCALSVNSVINSISKLLVSAVDNNIPFKNLPAVMLWGMPGVGKSQAVRAMAQTIQMATKKKTIVTDVRLLLFNPIDLRGIPVADVTRSFAVWLKPKIFDMDASDNVINFLFLDEISAAPPSVQAAAYQITLDRVIGEHKLPENCFVICAGNRVTDKSVAYKMPKALANRLCHFEVESDFKSWLDWATRTGLDQRVIAFLQTRPDYLVTFNSSNEDVAFATPRSWEMVSNILLAGNYSNLEDCFAIISGLVGIGIATEFVTWCKHNTFIPNIEDIAKGICNKLPTTTDSKYATSKLMLNYIKGHKFEKDITKNCIIYATRFSPDFTAAFFKELLLSNREVMYIREFSDWVKLHAAYFR